jgi:protein-disulfide isomerase
LPDTKTSRSSGLSRRGAIGLGLGALAAAGGGIAYYTLSGKEAEQSASADGAANMGVDPAKDKIMGDANAPVTLVEYSSLTCPHCANFHQMTVPDLKEKYVKTGKVRYVIREFPLDRIAFAAAAIARCAGSDKFFPFISALYKQQEVWARGEGDPAPRLFNMAKQVGFTQEAFNACLGNKDVIDHIEETRRRGNEVFGVNSTPTIFVNGKKVEGGNSLSDIEAAMSPFLKG